MACSSRGGRKRPYYLSLGEWRSPRRHEDEELAPARWLYMREQAPATLEAQLFGSAGTGFGGRLADQR